MSRTDHSSPSPTLIESALVDRAGRLACFCPPATPKWGPLPKARLAVLCLGFAASVLAQTLVTALLPLAGLMLAPKPWLSAAPYMAMIAGAAVATFPAAYLLDAFGRKASFALGASHGLAGGLMLAWAIAHQYFFMLLVGAFWLGIAQGFSLFYRHEAAIGESPRAASLAIVLVFGSGVLAGLIGPAVLMYAAQSFAQQSDVILSLAAALAQMAVLFLAIISADPQMSSDHTSPRHKGGWSFWMPTLCAAMAWFGMTQTMLAVPAAMQMCGLNLASIFAVMAWHVLVMYAPAFAVYPLARVIGAPAIACAGLVLIISAHIALTSAAQVIDFGVVLGALALGWSLTTTASTLWLHRHGSPQRWALAGHDGLLFAAALLGAFASGPSPLGLY